MISKLCDTMSIGMRTLTNTVKVVSTKQNILSKDIESLLLYILENSKEEKSIIDCSSTCVAVDDDRTTTSTINNHSNDYYNPNGTQQSINNIMGVKFKGVTGVDLRRFRRLNGLREEKDDDDDDDDESNNNNSNSNNNNNNNNNNKNRNNSNSNNNNNNVTNITNINNNNNTTLNNNINSNNNNNNINENLGADDSVAGVATRLNLFATELLLPSPRQPVVSAEFPRTWFELVDEWEREDLESFVRSRQAEWKPTSIVQRYHKRLRGMTLLRRKIDESRFAMSESDMAKRLDLERSAKDLSLSKHLQLLFKDDDNVIRRNRRPLFISP
jgi:hypothetical protein